MDNRISLKLKAAMDELDKVADTYGVARATHIALLANHLMEMAELLADIDNNKERHDDYQCNEVPSES